jgi:hypothetical protein
MTFFKSLKGGVAAFSIALGLMGPISVYAAGPAPVDFLSATNFTILSKTGITNTGSHTSAITGNIGSSPVTAAAMDNVFCSEITGTIYGIDAAYTGSGSTTCFAGNPGVPAVVPPDANKTLVDNAVLAMGTAYTNAEGRTNPDGTELYAGNLGGRTFAPGLYKWSSDVTIPTDVTLSGTANDVWIFQIAGNLTVSSAGSVPAGIKVLLNGGANAANVFWQVGGVTGATLGSYSTFNGNILSSKQVIVQTGAVLNGRAFAQTQVTLDASVVTFPAAVVPTPSGSRIGTISVVKRVINDNGRTRTMADFPLFVNGIAVSSGVTYDFPAYGGLYTVTESSDGNYKQIFSGDCDINGRMNLNPGENKICILTNDDIGAAPSVLPVPPLIDVVKVPSPLALPNGPGPVTYTYTVRNTGTVPVIDLTLVGDTCVPIVRISGDNNGDNKLDVNETWVHTCTTVLTKTHTNTVVVNGWANGLTATDIARSSVIVGQAVVPPLIHVTKVPYPLTLTASGGTVTYTKKVTNPGTAPLTNVRITDDNCGPVNFGGGDANGDGRLDPSETWTFTCSTSLTQTTTNTAVATGSANGLTAKDFAIATVVVAQGQTDASLVARLKGRILLQVQNQGEAWYLNPDDGKRYYMKDGVAAFALMRKFALGITNKDLAGIPTSISGMDGTSAIALRLRGKILLQVEHMGDAWYVNPVNARRYYMGRPQDAFTLMRMLGLGITNQDLSKIPIGMLE